MSEAPKKRVLSPEHLEKLKAARVKALEAKHKLGTIRKAQKEEERAEIDKKYQEVMAKKQPTQEEVEEVEEVKPKKKAAPKKKPTKKVIEISDSSSDDDDESSDDESEPEVEYIVRRSKSKGVSKAKPTKQQNVEYDTPKLSAEVARHMLKERVMSDAQQMAWKSLFPYHNF
jgi:hypothetical protein